MQRLIKNIDFVLVTVCERTGNKRSFGIYAIAIRNTGGHTDWLALHTLPLTHNSIKMISSMLPYWWLYNKEWVYIWSIQTCWTHI